ncbi:MAG: hypothetical protein ACI4JA_08255 [Oscillospiraceae bacterium]
MDNNCTEKTTINRWALLASFLLGAVLGFLFAPAKKGMVIGSYNSYNNFNKDREGEDLCDYDDCFDDDSDDEEESHWEDETESYSF